MIRFYFCLFFLCSLFVSCGPGIEYPITENYFIAVGDNASIVRSKDGKSWNVVNYTLSQHLKSIAYGYGVLVAVGVSDTVLVSTDKGDTWVYHNTGAGQDLNEVRFIDGKFIVVGNNGTIRYSYNGSAWIDASSGSLVGENLKSILYGNGSYVIYSASQKAFYGSFGSWTANTSVTATFGAGSPSHGIFDGTHFLITEGGAGIGVLYSSTGQDAHSTGLSLASLAIGADIHYQKGAGVNTYLLIGSNNIVGSSDFSNWTDRSTTLPNSGYSITSGRDGYVAVGASGMIVYSQDGMSWASVASPTADNLLYVISTIK